MSTVALAKDRSMPVVRWLPSPVTTFAAALCAVLALVALAKGLTDPDFFWHHTTGRLIANSGVPSVDPFSFTWSGRPWTPHEWLSELLIYRLVTGFGPAVAVALFGVLGGLSFGLLGGALVRSGIRTLPIVLACGAGAVVLVPYLTIRPQVISWLMLGALLAGLMLLRADRPALSLLLVPFFALWANLHGLYVVGLGVLLVYALFTLAGRTPMSSARRWLLAACAGALLASMLTPAGPIGLLYPLRYVDAGDWGLANIEEWQSPNFHEPAHLLLLGLILAVAANGGRATPGWLVALSYIGVAMSLLALRNAPLAALMAVPTLAMGIDARLRERRPPRSPAVRGRNATPRRVMELAAAAVVVVAAAVIIVPRVTLLASTEPPADQFPIRGVDALERLDPDARVLAEYGWGGYVISRLYERGGRVFVDGRNDMYDEAVLEDYSSIRAADPGWERLAERYGVEAILLPPDVTLVRGPAEAAGWCEAYRDANQVLLLRSCPS